MRECEALLGREPPRGVAVSVLTPLEFVYRIREGLWADLVLFRPGGDGFPPDPRAVEAVVIAGRVAARWGEPASRRAARLVASTLATARRRVAELTGASEHDVVRRSRHVPWEQG
ncbi:MAG: hypothetical protein K6T75_03955 [Acetobacteraceae bacterium]|nr:hypothetical protein [Acetobacteraceae bacterium]